MTNSSTKEQMTAPAFLLPEDFVREVSPETVEQSGIPCEDSEGTARLALPKDIVAGLDAQVRERWPLGKMQRSEANPPGPRQVSAIEKAWRSVMRRDGWTKGLEGTIGKPESYSTGTGVTINLFGFNPAHPAVRCALHQVGEAFGWEVSRANAAALRKAIEAVPATLRGLQPWILDARIDADEESARIEALREANRQQQQREEAREASKSIIRAIVAKAPAKAQAVIVAELDEDECDIQTDYFAHSTTRRVVIGFRTGSREDFRQLRAAAATFEPTAHLGTGRDTVTVSSKEDPDSEYPWKSRETLRADDGSTMVFQSEDEAREFVEHGISAAPECQPDYVGVVGFWRAAQQHGFEVHVQSVEHRDNWSMGAGNYLKAGHSNSSGWRVKSYPLDRERQTFGWGSMTGIEDATPDLDAARAAAREKTAEEAILRWCRAQGEGGPVMRQLGDSNRHRVGVLSGAWAPETLYSGNTWGEVLAQLPTLESDAEQSAEGCTILDTENKRGPMALVVPDERLDREAFETVRAACKKAGGWYSRKWGKTPGGFAFNIRDDAEAFASEWFAQDSKEEGKN